MKSLLSLIVATAATWGYLYHHGRGPAGSSPLPPPTPPAPAATHEGTRPRSSLPAEPPHDPDEDAPAKEGNPPTSLTGLVTALRLPVRAPAAGLLLDLTVREGQSVEAGQLLAAVDDSDARLEIARLATRAESARHQTEEARAALALAEDELRRNELLHTRGAGGAQTLTISRLAVRAQQARLAGIEAQLGGDFRLLELLDARLAVYRAAAPIAGTVAEVVRHRGTFVQQGEVLLHLESHEKELKVHVPPGSAADLAGKEFAFFHDGRWTFLPVARWKPGVNPDGSRSAMLKLPPGKLLSGQMLRVQVSRREGQP